MFDPKTLIEKVDPALRTEYTAALQAAEQALAGTTSTIAEHVAQRPDDPAAVAAWAAKWTPKRSQLETQQEAHAAIVETKQAELRDIRMRLVDAVRAAAVEQRAELALAHQAATATRRKMEAEALQIEQSAMREVLAVGGFLDRLHRDGLKALEATL